MNINYQKILNATHSTLLLFGVLLFFISSIAKSGEFSGNLSLEALAFKNEAQSSKQKQFYESISFQPEYFHEWDDGTQAFIFSGFGRLSRSDESRTHADVREIYWSLISDAWELRAGIRKVFWGVTESQHLVDIINQTDNVEGIDGEEKLGQPMLNFAWIQDWGTLDLYLLTGFRAREYPTEDARLRGDFLIDEDHAQFDSKAEESHIDFAARWSHVVGDWDIGLSHFYGTSREPRFMPQLTPQGLKLIPFYDIIHQSGIDIQATIENWLWKFEGIRRSGMDNTFHATTAGLEYSFFDVKSTGLDIGIVIEYLYDDRKDKASTPFENDTMLGLRFALNDEQSTEALFGIIADNDGDGVAASIEANRRIGEQFKATLEARLFTETEPSDFLHNFRNDDYVQLEIGYYF